MTYADWIRLLHPILAVTVVFPMIGVVVHFALQTRQRRLALEAKEKSKLPATVGREHVQIGRWLTGAVVGLTLVGLAHPIAKNIIKTNTLSESPGQVAFIVLMFGFAIASLVCLYRAKSKLWRGVFSTLTGMAVIVLGCQNGVFRRSSEWYISHYYYGMAAAMLMIVSLGILPEIYRSKTWRNVHIALNIAALAFFVIQGITGARDLLEIPLSWQEPFVWSCDYAAKTCGG